MKGFVILIAIFATTAFAMAGTLSGNPGTGLINIGITWGIVWLIYGRKKTNQN